MNVVFVQGTSLSISRAHWVQILNTSHSLSRIPGIDVWVVPRTSRPEAEDEVYTGMGFERHDRFRLRRLIAHTWYDRLGLKGDQLSPAAGFVGRRMGLWSLDRILAEAGGNGRPIAVYTRDQNIPAVCADLLRRHNALVVNEHHKFEYVETLEAKLKKKRPGRSRLGEFKRYAREIRDAELARLARFDGVVCTTHFIQQRLRDRSFARPTVCIPNGANLDTSDVPARPSDRHRDIDILYVGQLLRWKNVDLVIEALPHLPGRRLTVVGGGEGEDMARLRELASRLGVADRVDFRGQRPHAEIKSFMQRSRVGVVPLPRAGFPQARMFCCPLKALEMMAAGTPIVASRLQSVEGLLEDGKNALLVEPDSAKALAHGIERALHDEDLQDRLAQGGFATARQLSYAERGRRIVEFVQTCMESKKRR